MENRISIALEFLRDNKPFRVGDLLLGVSDTGAIQVTGWSQVTIIENLNKSQCLNELLEVKMLFNEMLASSKELSDFVQNRQVEYFLDFDDYGKAGFNICSEIRGNISWQMDIP